MIIIIISDSYVVDRPTQLICVSDIYLSAGKYKRHSNSCDDGDCVNSHEVDSIEAMMKSSFHSRYENYDYEENS